MGIEPFDIEMTESADEEVCFEMMVLIFTFMKMADWAEAYLEHY